MATHIDKIQQLYIALYGHPADAAGQTLWGNILLTDPNAIPTIAATFKNSPEYAETLGGKSNAAIVGAMYQNLFGHGPSSAQSADATAQLDAGGNIGTVMTGIISAASAADVAILNLKVRASTSFTASLDTTAEQTGFATDAGQATAKQYLAYVDDQLSFNATTTPFALNLVTTDIVNRAPWSAPDRIDQQVQELYVSYFSRAAETAGHDYWTALLDGDPNNANLQVLGGNFAKSKEYLDEYSQATNELKVTKVYENLFGRVAEPAGVKYWADLMNAGRITIDSVVKDIAAGAQTTDKYAFDAKVNVAQAITAAIDTPAEIQAYQGVSANAAVTNYIAAVKDVASYNTAIAPASIDALLSGLSRGSEPPPSPDAGNIQLVGVGTMEPMAGMF